MLREAMDQFRIAPAETVMIGDAETDLEAALAAGCRRVLVRTGKGRRRRPAGSSPICCRWRCTRTWPGRWKLFSPRMIGRLLRRLRVLLALGGMAGLALAAGFVWFAESIPWASPTTTPGPTPSWS